jgi:hypothetical protein
VPLETAINGRIKNEIISKQSLFLYDFLAVRHAFGGWSA